MTVYKIKRIIDFYISFIIIERESNCQISFLDTLVSRDNGRLLINVYRKPTHADRYQVISVAFHFHHYKNQKISTAATLIHRAPNLPNSENGRDQEIKRVYTALESVNSCPVNLIADIEGKKLFSPPVPKPEDVFQIA